MKSEYDSVFENHDDLRGQHCFTTEEADTMWHLRLEDFLDGDPDCGRDLDVVEIFSGVGSVHAAAIEAGYKAIAMDKDRIPKCTEIAGLHCENLLMLDGFENAIRLVRRLKVGGLLVAAPQCSSFVPPCRAQHQRCEKNLWYGDTSRAFVIDGNNMANGCAFLLRLAHSRGVQAVVENPPSSDIWKFPPMANTLAHLKGLAQENQSAIVARCGYSTEPYGKRFEKKFKFIGSDLTCPWLARIERGCGCPGKTIHCGAKHCSRASSNCDTFF